MILTVCWMGHVRSMAAKYVLDDRYKFQDVINIGVATTSPAVMDTLCTMADKILVVGDTMIKDKIPPQFASKIVFIDIGYDRWGTPNLPELLNLVEKKLKQAGVV